jgi:hypothetical protein
VGVDLPSDFGLRIADCGFTQKKGFIFRIIGPSERRLEILVMYDHLFRVDGNHNALAAKAHGRSLDERRVMDRGCVDRDLVASGKQKVPDVINVPDTASHGERHEYLLRRAAHDVKDDTALLVRRGDVQEGQFVSSLFIVYFCDLDRVSGIAQVYEADALYDPSRFHVKAGYDSFG